MIENIKAIINPTICINFDDIDKSIKIKENGLQAKLKGIIIDKISNNFFAFKLDSNICPNISPYINRTTPNINKGCDCILLYKKEERLFLFFIELKSNDYSKSEVKSQLIASQCFFVYIKELLDKFYNNIIDNITIINILYTSKNFKTSIRPKQPYIQDFCGINVIVESARKGENNFTRFPIGRYINHLDILE